MWDPDYREYVMYHFEEQGMELPPSFANDEEEEEGDNVDGADVNGRSVTTSRQVLNDTHQNDANLRQEVVNVDDLSSENDGDVAMEVEGVTAPFKHCNHEENVEFSRGEIDGLFCPICFNAWSSGGDHHVCCLPCGHIYGLSCIKKWLRQGSSKCPQCKRECEIKDIRLLYATRVVSVDEELQAKCAFLEKKNANWSKKEIDWKKREADLLRQVQFLNKAAEEDMEDRRREFEQVIEDKCKKFEQVLEDKCEQYFMSRVAAFLEEYHARLGSTSPQCNGPPANPDDTCPPPSTS